MTLWMVEPRDPLVLRDGRPNEGRSESSSLPFPYPSTMAGLVRTRLGSNPSGLFELGGDQLTQLLSTEIRGPLLVRPSDCVLFVPAPLDCLFVQEKSEKIHIRKLHPISVPENIVMDDAIPLEPVGLENTEVINGKPPRNTPAFWPWEVFCRWLENPENLSSEKVIREGLGAFPMETRVHVAVGPEGTVRESMLFSTTGIRFAENRLGGIPPSGDNLALLVDVGTCKVDGTEQKIHQGMAPAGGERRLCRWTPGEGVALPKPPQEVIRHLKSSNEAVRVRVILLTPAVFDQGSLPSTSTYRLASSRKDLEVTLVAARVPRPQTISGWDFARRRPKATRRLVSAGSVYWLELKGAPEARLRWLDDVWMHNISDQKQDRRDGFGLVAVGVSDEKSA